MATLLELWHFLRTRKKLVLVPLIAFLLLVGLIVVLQASAAAPFVYALF